MYSQQMIHISFKTQNNQVNSTVKPFDPLLLQSLESFRELMIGEFYREMIGNNELILVVKVKNLEGIYQDLNDELDWKQVVQNVVKKGQSLQFSISCKCAKKVYKRQMKEIEQRLKELEYETQILELKKKLIETNALNRINEKPQDPRDKLLESIRSGASLKKTPKTEKIVDCPREILMNSIKSRLSE